MGESAVRWVGYKSSWTGLLGIEFFGPGGGPSVAVTQYFVLMRGVSRQAQAGCLVLPVTGYTNGEFGRCWLAGGSGDDVP